MLRQNYLAFLACAKPTMWHPDIPPEYRNTLVVDDVLHFLRGIPDRSVPLFLFSPPYNLGITTGGGMPKKHSLGKWSGGDLADGYEFHDDAMLPSEYTEWQKEILIECWRCLTDNGAIYYQHKPRIQAGKVILPLEYNPALPLRQIVIWARAGGVNFSGSFYCPTHEWLMILAKDSFRLKSKRASGEGDVWYIPQDNDNWHPAPFPLALAKRVIETTMPLYVCDPFVGSGTTAIAAKIYRIGYMGCDNSPTYIQKANERLADKTLPLLGTLQQMALV